MPILSYRCTEENGLSFELLVDGQPLGVLIGSRDTTFPYWIVEDGLPRFPPHGPSDAPDVRIVCVCSCGEYGCGHAHCHIGHNGDQVVFSAFDFDVTREGALKTFQFESANYEAVCKEISARARQQRELVAAVHR